MKKRGKKGQAAMEFLMTYGWAILVVLVVIGALVYFMGPNIVQSMIPTKCVTGDAGLICKSAKVVGGDAAVSTFNILLQNNYDEEVYVTGVTVTSDQGASCSVVLSKVIAAGATDTSTGIQATTCGIPATSKGQKVKLAVTTTFYKKSETVSFAHPVKGEVVATVQ